MASNRAQVPTGDTVEGKSYSSPKTEFAATTLSHSMRDGSGQGLGGDENRGNIEHVGPRGPDGSVGRRGNHAVAGEEAEQELTWR